jgi:hypothetical protein
MIFQILKKLLYFLLNQFTSLELFINRTKIIHTKEGMIIEDAAGTQVIATPDVHVLDNSYLVVDGNTYYHRALDDDSTNAYDLAKRLTGYVQNEEQKESNLWTSTTQTPITKEEYVAAAQQRAKDNT